ncbi:MAG: DUF2905 domain-containing protein [Chloroflexota bacterium]
MDSRTTALLVIAVGAGIILIGLLMLAGGLSWFGRLPGDIRYEGDSSRVYIPITSMVLVSIVLSLLLAVVRRLL